jgi:photosystem II Psb28-2 protein
MTSAIPSIQFFQGIPETLSNVSLRRNRKGDRIVVMMFEHLSAIERFNSYTKRFNSAMRLVDCEGEISVEPSAVQFIFGGPEGDDLQRVECKFEIEREDHWERFMRFMHRYAEVNDMEFGRKDQG